MKSITMTDENGTYTIQPRECGNTIDQYFEMLVVPAMLAAGFSKYVIDDYLGNELTMGAPE